MTRNVTCSAWTRLDESIGAVIAKRERSRASVYEGIWLIVL